MDAYSLSKHYFLSMTALNIWNACYQKYDNFISYLIIPLKPDYIQFEHVSNAIIFVYTKKKKTKT